MPKKDSPKKMTDKQKYQSLKRQTERAGMRVVEKDGRLLVQRKAPKR